MICEDWRNLPAAAIEPLLAEERRRWLIDLGWDTHPTWRTVEEARASGRLPGFVLRDGARIAGWAFYLLHDDTVQVGALVADEARGLRLLIDALLQAPEAAYAEKISLFVLPDGGSLGTALTRRRFEMRRHEYLALDLSTDVRPRASAPDGPGTPLLRPFRAADEPHLVRLIAEAYRGQPAAECFAPHGRLDEWAWYVRQLLRTPACGTLIPDATFVVSFPGRDALAGLVMTTALSQSTAHIAQIVVSPEAQGSGVGRRLLDAAIARVKAHGADRITLMVADDNSRAKALYTTAGFVTGPTFLYGARLLPKRLARAS